MICDQQKGKIGFQNIMERLGDNEGDRWKRSRNKLINTVIDKITENCPGIS